MLYLFRLLQFLCVHLLNVNLNKSYNNYDDMTNINYDFLSLNEITCFEVNIIHVGNCYKITQPYFLCLPDSLYLL